MTGLAFLAAVLAFAALALSMDRHAQDLLGRRPTASRRRSLRRGGWSSMAMAYMFAIADWGMAIGSVLFIGLLSLAAAIVLLTMSRAASQH